MNVSFTGGMSSIYNSDYNAGNPKVVLADGQKISVTVLKNNGDGTCLVSFGGGKFKATARDFCSIFLSIFTPLCSMNSKTFDVTASGTRPLPSIKRTKEAANIFSSAGCSWIFPPASETVASKVWPA